MTNVRRSRGRPPSRPSRRRIGPPRTQPSAEQSPSPAETSQTLPPEETPSTSGISPQADQTVDEVPPNVTHCCTCGKIYRHMAFLASHVCNVDIGIQRVPSASTHEPPTTPRSFSPNVKSDRESEDHSQTSTSSNTKHSCDFCDSMSQIYQYDGSSGSRRSESDHECGICHKVFGCDSMLVIHLCRHSARTLGAEASTREQRPPSPDPERYPRLLKSIVQREQATMLVTASVTGAESASRSTSAAAGGRCLPEPTSENAANLCPKCLAQLHPLVSTEPEPRSPAVATTSQDWVVSSDDSQTRADCLACRVISERKVESFVRCLQHSESETPATVAASSQHRTVSSDGTPSKTDCVACRVISECNVDSSVTCLEHSAEERRHASPTLVRISVPVLARRINRPLPVEQPGEETDQSLPAATTEPAIYKCFVCQRPARSYQSAATQTESTPTPSTSGTKKYSKRKKKHRRHLERESENEPRTDETQGDVAGVSEVVVCDEPGEVPGGYVEEQEVAVQYAPEGHIEEQPTPSTSRVTKARQRFSTTDSVPGPSKPYPSSCEPRTRHGSYEDTTEVEEEAFEGNPEDEAESQPVGVVEQDIDGDIEEAPAEYDEDEEIEEPEHPERNLEEQRTGKNYTCPICKQNFTTQDDLRIHLPTHIRVRKFNCNLCPAQFNHSGSLTHHVCQAHGIGRRFVCEECGAGFSQKQRLVSHSRIHKDERPHKCEICGLEFRRPENLKEHKKGVHEGERFHCTLCPTTFSRSSHLTRHMKMVHKCNKQKRQ